MIIIHVFQMDINCILMFMIIIHVFQMDINCILMFDHNSCILNGY